MINFTTINISGQPNVTFNLKKRYDKTLTVRGDWLRIDWKCMKIALII